MAKSTFALFLIFVAVTIVFPFVLGKFMPGTEKVGFPLRFFQHTTAPPPDSSTTFSPVALVADLLICLAAAAAVAFLWELLKKSIR